MAWEDWVTLLQVCFSLTGIVLNGYIFHNLNHTIERHYWIVWSSLSSAHALCCSSLFTIGIVSLLGEQIFESEHDIIVIQQYTLLLCAILILFHMFSTATSDMIMTFRKMQSPPDNICFIVLPWLLTATTALLLGVWGSHEDVSSSISLIIMASDVILLFVYSLMMCFRMRQEVNEISRLGYDYVNHVIDDYCEEIRYFKGMNSFLALSFVVFTIPFAMERFMYHQNGVMSSFCICSSAVVHGLITLRWVEGTWTDVVYV